MTDRWLGAALVLAALSSACAQPAPLQPDEHANHPTPAATAPTVPETSRIIIIVTPSSAQAHPEATATAVGPGQSTGPIPTPVSDEHQH